MMITAIGASAIGAVWGWLLGSLDAPLRRPWQTAGAAGAATLLLAAGVVVLTGVSTVLLFFGAGATTLVLHMAWRRELRARFGSSPLGEREMV